MHSLVWKLSRNFSLLLYGLMIIGLMYLNYRHDPPDPALTGTATYGHNIAGEFEQNVIQTITELVILYLSLIPINLNLTVNFTAGKKFNKIAAVGGICGGIANHLGAAMIFTLRVAQGL